MTTLGQLQWPEQHGVTGQPLPRKGSGTAAAAAAAETTAAAEHQEQQWRRQQQRHQDQLRRARQRRAPPFDSKEQAATAAQVAARLAALQSGERHDRESLAVSLLVEGRPQAFVDFFELTAGEDEGAAAAADGRGEAEIAAANGGAEGGGAAAGPMPAEGLLLLRDQLVRADAALKAGDPPGAFDAYKQLGRFFVGRGQLEEAATFYGKCREVARGAGWADGELESSCALGLVYEQLRRADAAVACHERCLELALADPGDAAEARAAEARRTLVHVYAQQAEQREKGGDLAAAAAFLQKCAAAAGRCGDAAAAGAASHRLGLLSAAQGRWQEAADHQAAYVQRSREAGDAAAEGAARRAHAECLRQLGDAEGAIASLEAYLSLQEAAGDADPRGPALVWCQLGCLHHQRGAPEAAAAAFQRFFDLSRGLDQRLRDVARVNLGAARAEVRLRELAAAAAAE